MGLPELRKFLFEIRSLLPVVSLDIVFSARDPSLVKLYSLGQLKVAMIVDFVCETYDEQPNNEADSSHLLRIVTGDFLLWLNYLAPTNLRLFHFDMTMDSARNPNSSFASTTLVDLMRPDFSLYVRDAFILRWETRIDNAHFTAALEENAKKLKIWSPLYYGELPFVIGGCCRGNKFQ